MGEKEKAVLKYTFTLFQATHIISYKSGKGGRDCVSLF